MRTLLTLLASGILLATHAAQAAETDQVSHGQKVFESSCAACHSLVPPPKLAPPILGVAAHYRDAYPDEKEAVAHIVDFVKHPSKEKSLILNTSGQRWDLMAPMPLPDADLNAVARWMMESKMSVVPAGPGQGGGMGRGMGGGMNGGPGPMMR